MATGDQPRARDDVGDLAPQQRNVRRLGAVRGRREQAQKPIFSADLSLGVEALDRDVVEIAWPVDRRARGRLGHHQQLGPPGIGFHLRRQRRETRRDFLALAFAQDTQARPGDDLQRVFAVLDHQFVAAIAKKREVIVGQPGEKCLALRELIRRQRRRPLVGIGEDHLQPIAHRFPVGDGRAYIVEHADEVGGQFVKPRRLDNAVDLDANERFVSGVLGVVGGQIDKRAVGAALDGDDRMHDQVQRQPVPVDLHRHRIDQERHVVIDDLDDRVRRLPAMFLDRRIEYAHPRASGSRVRAKFQCDSAAP